MTIKKEYLGEENLCLLELHSFWIQTFESISLFFFKRQSTPPNISSFTEAISSKSVRMIMECWLRRILLFVKPIFKSISNKMFHICHFNAGKSVLLIFYLSVYWFIYLFFRHFCQFWKLFNLPLWSLLNNYNWYLHFSLSAEIHSQLEWKPAKYLALMTSGSKRCFIVEAASG